MCRVRNRPSQHCPGRRAGSAMRSRCRSPTAGRRSTARRSTTSPGASPGGEGWCSCTAVGPTPTGGRTSRPRFADEFRVVAVDLSGHGDSDHRDDVRARAVDRGGAGRRRRAAASTVRRSSSATAWAGSSRSPPRRCTRDRVVGRDRVRLTGDRRPTPRSSRYRLKEAFGRPRTYAIDRRRARALPHRARRRSTTSTT